MKILEIFQYTTIFVLSYLQLQNCMQFMDQTNESFQRTLSNIFDEKNIKRIRNIRVKISFIGENDLHLDEIIECTIKKNNETIPVYAILIHQAYLHNMLHWNDAKTNKDYLLKMNINRMVKITNIYAKKIFNVLDIFDVGEFYCIIQERNTNAKSLTDMMLKDTFTDWIAQKLILQRLYALKYLSSIGIVKNHAFLFDEPIDKKYNFKDGSFFSFIKERTPKLNENLEYVLAQNYLPRCLYCLNHRNGSFLSLFRKNWLEYNYYNLLMFCEKMSKCVRSHTNLKEKKEFIKLMMEFSIDGTNHINICINHSFFKANIISINDFRKIKFKKLRISSCEVERSQNKIMFKMFESKDEIEITIKETANKILLFSGRIHYHSLDIRINGILIDPDQEDEEEFKKLKSKIEDLFSEIELYTKDKVLLELTNDYISILKYKTKDSYAFIFKKHYVKDASTIFVEFKQEQVLLYNLPENITKSMSDEYRNEAMVCLKEFKKVESEVLDLFDQNPTKKNLFSLLLKSDLDPQHAELPYIYIPGVGVKILKRKSTENEYIEIYIIDDYEIVSISGGQYSIKNLIDNNGQKIVDITMMGYYMPKMQVLLEASYLKIIK